MAHGPYLPYRAVLHPHWQSVVSDLLGATIGELVAADNLEARARAFVVPADTADPEVVEALFENDVKLESMIVAALPVYLQRAALVALLVTRSNALTATLSAPTARATRRRSRTQSIGSLPCSMAPLLPSETRADHADREVGDRSFRP